MYFGPITQLSHLTDDLEKTAGLALHHRLRREKS